MADDKSSSKGDTAAGVGMAIAAGIAVFAVLLPVAVVAVGLVKGLRERLERTEASIIALAALVGLVIARNAVFVPYLHFVGRIYSKNFTLSGFPLMAFVLLPTLLAMFWLASGIDQYLGRAVPFLRRRYALKEKSLIPNARTKAKAKVAAPPTEKIMSHLASHSATGGPEPGRRQFVVGVDGKGRPVMLSEQELGTHGLIFGSTGSGKTKTIEAIAGGLMDLGWDVTIVDLKEDTGPEGLQDWLSVYGSTHALAFQPLALSSTNNQFWFNPLYGLGRDEARSAVLSLQEFDDAYWAALNQKMLGQMIGLMFDAHEVRPDKWEAPDLYRCGRLFSEFSEQGGASAAPKAVKDMVSDVLRAGIDRTETDYSSILKPTKPEAQSASGFGSKIINMYETQAGRSVLRSGPGRRVLDVTQPGITYIGLNSLGMQDLARVVSTAVLVRLCAYAGARITGADSSAGRRRCVIIDEANWVDRKQIANLLSRARSAGIAVVLCTQGPKDWMDKEDIDFSTLAQNVNFGIIMQQKDAESAEICADFIGKEDKVVVKQRMSGHWTQVGEGQVSEMEDYKVRPEHLRDNLEVGEAMLKVFAPKSRLTWMKIPLRAPEAGTRSH